MKNKNPNSIKTEVSCGPDKKRLKKVLVSTKEAKEMIEDLYENDFFPYEVTDQIRGAIRLRIEDIEKSLKEIK